MEEEGEIGVYDKASYRSHYLILNSSSLLNLSDINLFPDNLRMLG